MSDEMPQIEVGDVVSYRDQNGNVWEGRADAFLVLWLAQHPEFTVESIMRPAFIWRREAQS